MNYKNPVPVVVMLVRAINENGTVRYLTHTRGIEPNMYGQAFPSGYVNEGETAETAASRELKEEIGLDIPAWMWKPICTKITQTNRLLIFMRLECLTADDDVIKNFVPNREVLGVSFAVPGDTLCFPTHTEVLREL